MDSIKMIFISTTCLVSTVMIGVTLGQSSFGYSQNFESEWERANPACAGPHQSPIHINTQRAVQVAAPALELDGYNNLLAPPVTLHNNGHSAELRPRKIPVSDITPQIFGGLLSHKYHLESFHFHWGSRNSRGSEHVIDSVRYPMEMHILHRNEKYENVTEAMNHPDGLVVLAFFFETRERNNAALAPILSQLPRTLEEGESTELPGSFALATLLPPTDVFYMYRGSLTTPPCSEVVTWIVFPDPSTISFQQINVFRSLVTKDKKNHHLQDNYRHLEPLNSRKIYVKRLPADPTTFHNRNFTYFGLDPEI